MYCILPSHVVVFHIRCAFQVDEKHCVKTWPMYIRTFTAMQQTKTRTVNKLGILHQACFFASVELMSFVQISFVSRMCVGSERVCSPSWVYRMQLGSRKKKKKKVSFLDLYTKKKKQRGNSEEDVPPLFCSASLWFISYCCFHSL